VMSSVSVCTRELQLVEIEICCIHEVRK
jgi:hypothetical protein